MRSATLRGAGGSRRRAGRLAVRAAKVRLDAGDPPRRPAGFGDLAAAVRDVVLPGAARRSVRIRTFKPLRPPVRGRSCAATEGWCRSPPGSRRSSSSSPTPDEQAATITAKTRNQPTMSFMRRLHGTGRYLPRGSCRLNCELALARSMSRLINAPSTELATDRARRPAPVRTCRFARVRGTAGRAEDWGVVKMSLFAGPMAQRRLQRPSWESRTPNSGGTARDEVAGARGRPAAVLGWVVCFPVLRKGLGDVRRIPGAVWRGPPATRNRKSLARPDDRPFMSLGGWPGGFRRLAVAAQRGSAKSCATEWQPPDRRATAAPPRDRARGLRGHRPRDHEVDPVANRALLSPRPSSFRTRGRRRAGPRSLDRGLHWTLAHELLDRIALVDRQPRRRARSCTVREHARSAGSLSSSARSEVHHRNLEDGPACGPLPPARFLAPWRSPIWRMRKLSDASSEICRRLPRIVVVYPRCLASATVRSMYSCTFRERLEVACRGSRAAWSVGMLSRLAEPRTPSIPNASP